MVPFDGRSAIYHDGTKAMQAPSFEVGVFDSQSALNDDLSDIQMLKTALTTSIKQFMRQIGKQKIVIGLSG